MANLRLNRQDLLAGTGLFGSVPHAPLEDLAARASTVALDQNEMLFFKGDPGDRLYIVISGAIRIGVTSPEGREVSYGVLGPGAILGEIAVIDGGHRSADAKAMEPSLLLALERRDVLAFLQQNPDQAVHLLKLLCGRIRRADEMLDDVVFMSLPSRLAKHLLTLKEIVGSTGSAPNKPELRLSQQVLAEHLGISRESVNKVLSKWEVVGIVSLGRGRIMLDRVDSLREIAESG
jgi:CRP-like cAMP-binding protein